MNMMVMSLLLVAAKMHVPVLHVRHGGIGGFGILLVKMIHFVSYKDLEIHVVGHKNVVTQGDVVSLAVHLFFKEEAVVDCSDIILIGHGELITQNTLSMIETFKSYAV